MNKSEELIACLEGEIAKRDARIVELDKKYGWALSELSAIKAQGPVAYDVYDDADDQLAHTIRASDTERVAHYRASPGAWRMVALYAAPVSEAKAQGVVMPAELDRAFITGESCDGVYRVVIQSETLKEMQAVHRWLARLNAAPVQQVSVPDGWRLVPVEPTKAMLFACEDAGSIHNQQRGKRIYNAMLAAAPAAPAADAGLVEALEKLARLGNGDKYGNSDGNLIAQAALAAHSSKGVV